MPNQLINENELQKIEKVINEIKKKSSNGDYIYRGEHKHYCKVSSALYREYVNTHKCLENHEYITNNQDISVDSMIDFQDPSWRLRFQIATKRPSLKNNHRILGTMTQIIKRRPSILRRLKSLLNFNDYGGDITEALLTSRIGLFYHTGVFRMCRRTSSGLDALGYLDKTYRISTAKLSSPITLLHRVIGLNKTYGTSFTHAKALLTGPMSI